MVNEFPRRRKNKEDLSEDELGPDSDYFESSDSRSHYDNSHEAADARPLSQLPGEPLILSRDQHNISRKHIDPEALKVLYRLQRHGYRAFLVGGGVRDLLLGKKPKDFDISTDADPEDVRSLFRNSRIIGRRFKINHVYFHGNKIIEVATFRADGGNDAEETAVPGSADNTYGDPLTDAFRRDLTINGLFYDASDFSVIDYVGGIADLEAGVIRIIGEPEARFNEDPVRMIRAIRHAARTGFIIEPATYQAICDLKTLIRLCPKARVYEEFVRDLRGGHSLDAFRLFEATGLLGHLMPALATAIAEDTQNVWGRLERTLGEIDREIKAGQEINTAVLFAALMIGNFPSVLFGTDKERGQLDEMRIYWEISPEELLDDDSEENEGRDRKFEEDCLEDGISEVFTSLGVSRKDREWMYDVLIARVRLLDNFLSQIETPPVRNRDLLRDSLSLLRLTAHDKLSHDALAFWEERIDRQENRGAQIGRKRRRGGRRKRER